MNNAILFLLYPAITVAGALFTQVAGNNHRSLPEGFLAWIFLPIMAIGALVVWITEGKTEVKKYVNDFLQTFLNYEFEYFHFNNKNKILNH